MLVVVHQRDVELFLQPTLNFKRLGRFDVLQVDAPKRRCNGLHGGDKLVHVGGVHFNVEHINVRKDLEQHPFSFHHRLARLRTNVPQSKNSGAVADHRDQVALGRVRVHVLGILRNGNARLCHTGAVGQTQIPLGAVRLGRNDFHFAPTLPGVVF